METLEARLSSVRPAQGSVEAAGVVEPVELDPLLESSPPPIISIVELEEQQTIIKPRIPIIATCDIYLIATLFLSCQGG
jgi:hypothetical protein